MSNSTDDNIEDVKDFHPPTNSERMNTITNQIRLIEQMRKLEDAPVDTMGCHMLAEESAGPKTHRFQTLIALMLSSQTKDQVTAAAMEKLKAHGCTIDKIISTSNDDLEELIKPVGFYRRKSIYIKQTAKKLKQDYDGDVPNTFDGLCSLPGVGPKMANLALKICFGIIQGIGVDTHVHRISNRLGWVKTSTPNKTEDGLQQILPMKMWDTVNKLLVGFGQQVCLPVRPRCEECLVGQSDLCPFFGKASKRTKLSNHTVF